MRNQYTKDVPHWGANIKKMNCNLFQNIFLGLPGESWLLYSLVSLL